MIALLTDLAIGLGALPFAFARTLSGRWERLSCALAGGMMISASVFSLAEQGLRHGSVAEIVLGMLAGALFFWLTARYLETNQWHIAELSLQDSKQAVLMVTAMFVHSIPEGIATGVGYATGDLRFGLLLTIKYFLHSQCIQGDAVDRGSPAACAAGGINSRFRVCSTVRRVRLLRCRSMRGQASEYHPQEIDRRSGPEPAPFGYSRFHRCSCTRGESSTHHRWPSG